MIGNLKIIIGVVLSVVSAIDASYPSCYKDDSRYNALRKQLRSRKQRLQYEGEVSDNFLFRWEFQKYCHHVYDPRTDKKHFPTNPDGGVTFDPENVRPGDIVFVRDPELFFATLYHNIKHPYIIVVHGQSFDGVEEKFYEFLDDERIIAYFTIHPIEKSHPKIRILPVGVVQGPDIVEQRQEMSALFKRLRETSKKKQLLYCNFLDRTNETRKGVRECFEDAPYCCVAKRCSFSKYIKQVAESTFVLSPPGRGPDANRTWETLLVGSIPVVLSSQLNPLYEDLPVLVVNDWTDVNEDFLREKYSEILEKQYDLRKLYMEYWLKRIENVRQEFLAKNSGAPKPPLSLWSRCKSWLLKKISQ